MYINECTALASVAARNGCGIKLEHPYGTIFRALVQGEGKHPTQRAFIISLIEMDADLFHAVLYLPRSQISPGEFVVVSVLKGDVAKVIIPQDTTLVPIPGRGCEWLTPEVVVSFGYSPDTNRPTVDWYTHSGKRPSIRHYDVNSTLPGEYCINLRKD